MPESQTRQSVPSKTLFDCLDAMHGVGSRGEFNRATNRAERKFCDGSCDDRDGHVGDVVVVRVYDGTHDWGFFSYCASAIDEDKKRGLSVFSNVARVSGVTEADGKKD